VRHGDQPDEQLFRALFTAVRISSTVICPSALASPAPQAEMSVLPSAILTMVRISSTVTEWLLLQSPTQRGGDGVRVGVKIGVLVDSVVGVDVGVSA
jgi:hypothetical protein